MRMFGDYLAMGPLRGGFLGFGQSGTEKSSTGNLNSIFNYALPTAEASQTSGNTALNTAGGTLASAGDYFKKLLTAGRTDTAARSAPAINAALATGDAAKRQAAATGTGRTGGTAAANREADVTTQGNIDNIINTNLMQGQQEGAAGLAQVGGEQTALGSTLLNNAAQLLGIGTTASGDELSAATSKENAQTEAFGRIISNLI